MREYRNFIIEKSNSEYESPTGDWVLLSDVETLLEMFDTDITSKTKSVLEYIKTLSDDVESELDEIYDKI